MLCNKKQVKGQQEYFFKLKKIINYGVFFIYFFCTALEFQRKVMEMDLRSLKKRDGENYEATQIQQVSTVEALNLIDRSLNSLEEKQKLVR